MKQRRRQPGEPVLPPHTIDWGDKESRRRKISPLFTFVGALAAAGAGMGLYFFLTQPAGLLSSKNAMDRCLDRLIDRTVSEMAPPNNTTIDISKGTFTNLLIECNTRHPEISPRWYKANFPEIFDPKLPNRSLHIRTDDTGEYRIIGVFLPITEKSALMPEEPPTVVVRMLPLCEVKPDLCGPKP